MAREAADLSSIKGVLAFVMADTLECIMTKNRHEILVRSRQAELDISEQVEPMFGATATSVANEWFEVVEATDCLGAIRWRERVNHHIGCVGLHLQQARLASGK